MNRVLPIQIAASYCLALVCAVPAFALSPPVQPLAKQPPIAVMPPPRINAAGAEIPIRIDSVSVTTQIAGRLAQTSVQLVFFNPNGRQLEGELQFPLLDGQEVTGFAMDFNGQLREAVPIEKSRGQAVFEDITRVRVDPALAEKTIGNNFKLRVYPLFARSKKIIVVRYQEALPERGGMLGYRLPLNFGERIGRFTWAGSIASGAVPQHVRGPLDEVKFNRVANGFDLSAERRDVQLSGVAELAIPARGAALATTQEFDGATYFYAEPSVPVSTAGVRAAPKRIAIYWDASGSGAERDHAREIAVLSTYFERFRNIEVALVLFRDVAEAPRNFSVVNGEWAALRRAIESAVYDGASNFSHIEQTNGGQVNGGQINGALRGAQLAGIDEALLFSDGLANYGNTAVPKSATRIHAVSAVAKSDSAFLRALAEQSGGRYADALKLGSAGAAAMLVNQAPRVLIESTQGIADAQLTSPFAENGRVQLAGRLTETEGRVVLRIESSGAKPAFVTVPIRRASTGGGFAAQRWAAMKVTALEADYDLNRTQVERLGKRFRLITRGTSLIILDTANDYARFDIEPPLELRAEYERLRSAGVRSRDADRLAHLERVVRQFQEKQAWWERDFPKGDKPVAKLEKAKGAVTVQGVRPGAAESREDSRRERDAAPMREAPAAAPMMAGAANRMQLADSAAKSAESVAGGNANTAMSIRLLPFAPDSAYARRLRDADAFNLYRIYLDERASHQNSTAFFLDVADLLFAKNEKVLALRVLSNLVEMNLENRHILRILGYRLMQAAEPEAAVTIFKRVRDLSPEEPQSHRDLGLAYSAAGQSQRAVDALTEVVTRPWHGRFPDVEIITLAELNAIIAQSPAKLDLARIDPRLIRNLPLDVRAVLAWDADNTDIDLYVTDPNGDTAFFGNARTFQGGRMSADFTGGYGPEEFSLKNAKPGKYRVEAQFYGHRQQVVAGATTLMLKLTTRFGTEGARNQLVTLRLKDAGSKVLVGEFEVGGS